MLGLVVRACFSLALMYRVLRIEYESRQCRRVATQSRFSFILFLFSFRNEAGYHYHTRDDNIACDCCRFDMLFLLSLFFLAGRTDLLMVIETQCRKSQQDIEKLLYVEEMEILE